jgi:hypothetical protein
MSFEFFIVCLTSLLYVTCSLIIYVVESNKLRIVNPSSYQAMSFSFLHLCLSLSLVYFSLNLKISKKKINNPFNSLVKTKKCTILSMFALIYTEEKHRRKMSRTMSAVDFVPSFFLLSLSLILSIPFFLM